MLLKLVFNDEPIVFTVAMITTEIPASLTPLDFRSRCFFTEKN